MRISDWSSDVCSSDLVKERRGSTYNGNGDDESNGERAGETARHRLQLALRFPDQPTGTQQRITNDKAAPSQQAEGCQPIPPAASIYATFYSDALQQCAESSEEHTSEIQSLMRLPYAVFCLKKKNKRIRRHGFNHINEQTQQQSIKQENILRKIQ